MTPGLSLPLLDNKPSGIPVQVHAVWNQELAFAANTKDFGKPMPGIAGCVYLFDQKLALPTLADGALVVYLWDETHGTKPEDVNGKPLEVFAFSNDIVKQLEKKDPAGWCYAIFLPMASYKPEITKVRLRVAFLRASQGPKADPIFSADYHVDLGGRPTSEMQVTKKSVLGAPVQGVMERSGPLQAQVSKAPVALNQTSYQAPQGASQGSGPVTAAGWENKTTVLNAPANNGSANDMPGNPPGVFIPPAGPLQAAIQQAAANARQASNGGGNLTIPLAGTSPASGMQAGAANSSSPSQLMIYSSGQR